MGRAVRVGLYLCLLALGAAAIAAGVQAAPEQEPNDSPLAAQDMTLTWTYTGTTNQSDTDYFRVTLASGGLLTVVHNAPSTVEIIIAFEQNLTAVTPNPYAINYTAVGYGIIVARSESYLIRVYSLYAQTDGYEVSASFGDYAPIQGSTEVEYNNEPANATLMTLGYDHQGRFDMWFPGDVDWWKVNVTGPGLLSLSGTYSSISTQFYDASNMSLLSLHPGYSPLGSFSGAILENTQGPVLIRVVAASSVLYTVRAEFEVGLSSIEGNDETERNDARAAAQPLANAVAVEGLLGSGYGDTDWWYVEAVAAGTLLVSSDTGSPIYSFMVLELWDNSSATSNAQVSLEVNVGVDQVGFVLDQPGFYFIKLRGNSVTYNYTLEVDVQAGFAGVAGPDEIEPNGDAESATSWQAEQQAAGLAAAAYSDVDWWHTNFTEAGLLTVHLYTCCADQIGARVFIGSPTATPILLGVLNAAPAEFTVILDGATELFVQISTNYAPNGYYSLGANFSTDFSRIEGLDEVEPNNRPSTAQPMPGTLEARGKVDNLLGDVDYWSYEVPATGFLALWLAPDHDQFRIVLLNFSSTGWGWTSPQSPDFVYAVEPGPVTFGVYSFGGFFDYSFRIQWVSSLQGLTALPGEVEPNDDAGLAVPLAGNVSYSGAIVPGADDVDFIHYHGAAGDLVQLDFAVSGGFLAPPRIQELGGDTAAGNVNGGYDPGEGRRVYLFNEDGFIGFALSVSNYDETQYTLTFTVVKTGLYQGGGGVTLAQLAAFGQIGLNLSGSWRGAITDEIDSHLGQLMGPLLCAEHSLDASIERVRVEEGDIFASPTDSTVAYVAAEDQELELPEEHFACIQVFARFKAAAGSPGLVSEPFIASGHASGDEIILLQTMSRENLFGLKALLSLWAVTSNLSQADLELWRVTPSLAREANDILALAGVPQRLPIPRDPFAPEPNNPTPSPTMGPALTLALVSLVAVLGLVAVVSAVLLVRANRRKGGATAEDVANALLWPLKVDGPAAPLPPPPGWVAPPGPPARGLVSPLSAPLPAPPGFSGPSAPAAGLAYGSSPSEPRSTARGAAYCRCGAQRFPGYMRCPRCGYIF